MKKNLHIGVIVLLLFLMTTPIFGQTPPPLGVTSNFALFTSNGAVTNVGISQITGNVGTNVGSSTGFGNVNGQMHDQDGLTATAAFDLNIAFLNLGAQIPTMFPGILLGGGTTLNPAVYGVPAPSTLTDTLTLDGLGDPNACFVFQLTGAFATDPGAVIVLANGTKACNVFWKIDGAVSMAAGTVFKGTIICDGAIGMASGDDLEGRALSVNGAITISNSKSSTPIGCGSPVLTGPLAPPMGSLNCYALLTTNGALTNTGITYIIGDVGTNNGLVGGFNPLFVTGMIHSVPDPSTATGSADLNVLYTNLNSLAYDIELLYPAQFGNNLVLTPHVYLMNSAATFTDSVFLNAEGNANAIFVIQINGALSTSTYSNVVLINGTQAKNVFWKVEGAVNINDYSTFNGTIVANNGAIELFYGDTLNGRALSIAGAITTHDVTMTINSGPVSITPNDTVNLCMGDSVVLTATGGTSYLWSNGATTQTITVDTTGSFSVIVGNACSPNDTSAITFVILNTAPGVGFTVSPNDSICTGGMVTLSGTGSTSYTWTGGITNGVPFSPALSGSYTVTGSDTTACINTAIATITIIPNIIVGYTATPNDTVCIGTNVTLNGTGGISYIWSGGVINGLPFVATSSNTYTVTGTNTAGCNATATATITVVPVPTIGYLVGPNDTVCAGNQITLNGTGSISYTWTGGVINGVPFTPMGSMTYTVTGTTSPGCSNTASVNIVAVANPVVSLGPDVVQFSPFTTLDAGVGFSSYLWSTSATTQSIVVNTNGIFIVTVTNSFGCIDNDTIQVNFTSSILNNNGTQTILSLYPNPSNGPTNIRIDNLETENLVINVMDMSGKLVYTKYIGSVNGNFIDSFDFNSFRTGIYILQMTANSKTVAIRFVINK